MLILVVFLLLIFFVSLISNRLEGSIITMPIIFTTAGIILELATSATSQPIMGRTTFLRLSELALVLILFTDSARIRLQPLFFSSSLPTRLLSIGMPLTILLGALPALLLIPGLSLWEACILAAVLAPTDAGLGRIIVTSPKVPVRIRQGLNVEAGLNDGLSVPFLMLFIAVAMSGVKGAGRILIQNAFEQIILGALIGIGIGLVGGWLLGQAERRKYLNKDFGQFGLLSVPMLCLIAAEPIHASPFIAAFVGGLSVQIGFKDASLHALDFSEQWGQLLNLLVFFIFGILIPSFVSQMSISYWIYALASLTVIRMLPTALALAGTHLKPATVLFMGWFGPRGLASLVLGLVFLEKESKLAGEPYIRSAIIATVLLSVFAHGLSAKPGIALYSRMTGGLGFDAPERKESD